MHHGIRLAGAESDPILPGMQRLHPYCETERRGSADTLVSWSRYQMICSHLFLSIVKGC